MPLSPSLPPSLATFFVGSLGELERNQHPGAGLSRYYRVVELAMESNSEDVVETALGQLHKLVGECANA